MRRTAVELQAKIEQAKEQGRLGRDDLAQQLYSEVIAQDSPKLNNEEQFQILRAYINRGIVFLRLGQEELARQDWQTVVSAPCPRDEWLDRVKIRAFRNLAHLEKLSPPISAFIQMALKHYSDSPHLSVQRVLFEAALDTAWIYPLDSALIGFVQSLLGNFSAHEDIALVWTTLNKEERQLTRKWWGNNNETFLLPSIKTLGATFLDEVGSQVLSITPPPYKIQENALGRGGIKKLFLGHNALGWLTTNHRLEFFPDRRVETEHVRYLAFCPKRNTLAVVGDARMQRIDLYKPNGMEKIQSRAPIRGLAWGAELGWVDQHGFFMGNIKVDSAPLDGLVFWKKEFRTWNKNGLWKIVEKDKNIELLGGGGDLALVGSESFAFLRGKHVDFESAKGHRWVLELDEKPEMACLGLGGWSAWVIQKTIYLYDKDTLVRKVENLEPSCLFWLGRQLLVGCQDWSLRVISPRSSDSDLTIRHHNDWITDIAYDEDRNLLYVGGLDGQVSVWNPNNWELVDILGQKAALKLGWLRGWYRFGLSWVLAPNATHPLGWGDPILSHHLDQDGLHLLTLKGKYFGTRGSVFKPQARWLGEFQGGLAFSFPSKLETQQRTLMLPQAEAWVTQSLRWGSEWVLGTSQGLLYKVHEDETFTLSETYHVGAIKGLQIVRRDLRYPGTNDSTYFLSSGDDGKLIVWGWESFHAIEILKTAGQALLGVLACGRVVVGWDGSPMLYFWGIPGSSGFWSIKAHSKGVSCCVVDRSRRFLISGGKEGEVKIWQLPDGKLLSRLIKLDEPVVDLAWGENNNLGILGFSGEMIELNLNSEFNSSFS